MKWLGIFLITLVSACASLRNGSRTPAQINALELLEQIKVWSRDESISSITAKNCNETLLAISAQIEKSLMNQANFELTPPQWSEFEKNFFKFRTELTDRMLPWPKACVRTFRQINTDIRNLRDYAGEKIFTSNVDGYSEQLGSGFDLNKFAFKTGDILLTRGNSVLSSTISQISDNKNHFTHALFIYIDEITKEVFTLESYPNKGTQIYPLREALKNDNMRILLLRPKDSDKARDAVNYMYKIITTAAKAGHPILYDYNYDSEDHSKLSCVEVIQQAYADTAKIRVPAFKSRIRNGNEPFLQSIGIEDGEFFVPADLETDPRFQAFFEWTVYGLVSDQRKKDRIVAKIFEWISHEKYELLTTNRALVAHLIRSTSGYPSAWQLLSARVGGDKIPKDIPPKILAAMVKISDVGDLLSGVIAIKEKAMSPLARNLTEGELDRLLESYRNEDREQYVYSGRGELHQLMRPNNLKSIDP